MRGTLDSDPDSMRRCQQLTETLFENATLDQMWHEFGIVGNLIVRISDLYFIETTNLFPFLSSHSQMTSLVLTYTNSLPRIYSTSSSKEHLKTI